MSKINTSIELDFTAFTLSGYIPLELQKEKPVYQLFATIVILQCNFTLSTKLSRTTSQPAPQRPAGCDFTFCPLADQFASGDSRHWAAFAFAQLYYTNANPLLKHNFAQCHRGGLSYGHYTAFAQNVNVQEWFLYNDSKTALIGAPEKQVRFSERKSLMCPTLEQRPAPQSEKHRICGHSPAIHQLHWSSSTPLVKHALAETPSINSNAVLFLLRARNSWQQIPGCQAYLLFYQKSTNQLIKRQSITNPYNWPHTIFKDSQMEEELDGEENIDV